MKSGVSPTPVCVLTGGLATLLAATVGLVTSSDARAQIINFPASQWGKLNPEYRGNQIDLVTSFNRRAPNFELIARFSKRNRYRRLAAPVGRIELRIQRADGRVGVSFCTGTIISSRYILTNYHCIPGKGGNRVLKAQIRFGYITRKTWGRAYPLAIRPTEGDARLDYAVVAVQNDPSAQYGSIRLKLGAVEAGEELFIIHHPLGQPKRLTRKDCRAAPQGHLAGFRLRHVCDTEGGSSGSLIFSDISNSLVGLHFAGGLNANRPGSANNAIQIALIVQHSSILKALATGKKVPVTPRVPVGSAPPGPRGSGGPLLPGTSPRVPPPPRPAGPGAAPGGANQDQRLTRYLVGSWNGRMTDGRRSILRFRQRGRFQLIDVTRRIAVIGSWRVSGGRVLLVGDKLCRPTGCQPLNPPRNLPLNFQRVDQNTFRTSRAVFRRAQ